MPYDQNTFSSPGKNKPIAPPHSESPLVKPPGTGIAGKADRPSSSKVTT
jgi:hypothetical protein